MTTPKHATIYSAGADVSATETIVIPPKQLAFVKTGTFVPEGMPINHFFMLLPRSSICLKKGLIQPNSVGIIDMDYPDEVLLPFLNLGELPVTIEEGERIGQLICMEYKNIFPVINATRTGGFGSTNETTILDILS